MSEKTIHSAKIKLGLSLFWFLFTFSLVVWWWFFALRQLDLLVEVLQPEKYTRIKSMLVWEGAVLVLAVFFGGLVLVILTNREQVRNERLRKFFSNFTHDLKTSLTRLRLRTEVLAEKNSSPEFQKLLDEAARLDLQLENSLWVARGDSQRLLKENIKLSSIIGSLRVEWPEIEVKLYQDVDITADGQALKSVFRNILQNSWLHGQAKKIEIKPVQDKKFWRIEIKDDGKGFSGDLTQLGSQLLKSKSDKGNGLGLFLTQDLVERMSGEIQFLKSEQGFLVHILLPAAEHV
ncbi:MAG: sensor histidine kinase [Pseudobdellovibrio sp.]